MADSRGSLKKHNRSQHPVECLTSHWSLINNYYLIALCEIRLEVEPSKQKQNYLSGYYIEEPNQALTFEQTFACRV